MRFLKKTLAAILTVVLSITLFSGTVVFAAAPTLDGYNVKPATDSAYSTVLGKSIVKTYGGQQSNVYTYGASGFTANFIGTEFWMYVPELPQEDSNNDGQMETFSQDVMVLVDTDMPMEATMVTITEPGWVRLASGLEEGSHTITMRKASRDFPSSIWYSVRYVAVSHIATDGEFLAPEPRKDLVIEVYGDSISNGDAVWDNGGTGRAYTYGSYSSIVGRLLGGEIRVCGNSGNGLLGWVMATPGNGQVENLFPPQANWNKFDTSFDGSINWDHSGNNAADVVIINLGTNDRKELGGGDLTDTAFENEYIRFIKQIKTDCPEAIVICTVGAMGLLKGDNYDVDFNRITTECNNWAEEEFTFFTELQNCSTIPGGLGYDNSHPSNVAQEVYGLQIAKIINEKLDLGVDLTEKEETKSSNINLDQTYVSSSEYSSDHATAKAFDTLESTSWQAKQNTANGAFIQVNYDKEYTISKVVVDFEESYPTGTTKIEYSLDGANWKVFKTFEATEVTSYTLVATPVKAKHLKMTFSGTSNGKNYPAKVREFEAYESDEEGGAEVSYTVAQKSSNDDGKRVRLMAAVEGLDYKKVGFEITVKDDNHATTNVTTWEDTAVYTSIAGITAEDLGIANGYLFALTITEMPDDTVLSVKAYTVDTDGNKIYGNGGTATAVVLVNGVLNVVN